MTDLVPAISPGGGGDRGGGLPPGLARLLQLQAESNRGGGGVPPGLFQAFSATNQRISSLEGAIGNVPTSSDLTRAVREATTATQTTVPTSGPKVPTTTAPTMPDIPEVPGTPTYPEMPKWGGTDGGGPSNTGPDLEQSETYDLQDETGGGTLEKVARTGGEAGHQAGQAVNGVMDTLTRTGNTIAQSTKAVSGKSYSVDDTWADPNRSESNSDRQIYSGPVYEGPDPLNLGPNKGALYEGPDPLNLGGNKNKKKKKSSAKTSPGDSSPKSNSPGENSRERKRLAQYLKL